MTDAIIVGAGLGGLACAAKLARTGLEVLVLEKSPHIGGTSAVFRRGPYLFPMGPLSFSFPGRVRRFLDDVGAGANLSFRRNHFQLVSPNFDLIYSQPLEDLAAELARTFPTEAGGLKRVFTELEAMIESLAAKRVDPEEHQFWATTPAAAFLGRHLRDPRLLALLGSQGTSPPEMSLLNLAIMWRAMSAEGIWFPDGGIDGLCRRLGSAVADADGSIRISSPVERIIIENGRAVGVETADGGVIRAGWVISNADSKTTFLELLAGAAVPAGHLETIRRVPYTGSGISLCLGVDLKKVDLGRMKATHLFFRAEDRPVRPGDEEDFGNREIEVCRWSDNLTQAAPEGKAALVLRLSFPYEAVAGWRTGEKARKPGYREYKNGLSRKLIETAERILPGLSDGTEVQDMATPLTYRDWGQRYLGSIAGWTWSAEAGARWNEPFLVRTPVENLLSVGIYAARELVFGGVPTAIQTAELAAEAVLQG